MNRLKTTILAGALSATMAIPAFANESPSLSAPLPQFSAADASLIFEADAKPMQLAALSQQEMKETEGAIFWMYYAYASAPAMYGAANWMNSTGWRTIPVTYYNIRNQWRNWDWY